MSVHGRFGGLATIEIVGMHTASQNASSSGDFSKKVKLDYSNRNMTRLEQ